MTSLGMASPAIHWGKIIDISKTHMGDHDPGYDRQSKVTFTFSVGGDDWVVVAYALREDAKHGWLEGDDRWGCHLKWWSRKDFKPCFTNLYAPSRKELKEKVADFIFDGWHNKSIHPLNQEYDACWASETDLMEGEMTTKEWANWWQKAREWHDD